MPLGRKETEMSKSKKKEHTKKESPHEIIMDVRRQGKALQKKKREKGRLVETDIDLFAEDEKK